MSLSFEDNYEIINQEIQKRKGKWSLTSLSFMDFDDVAQIIRVHIHKKWEQYDQTKPLVNWLNKTISNQIKNIIRNNYTNFARPCLRCPAFQGEDLCEIYQTQCSECPLYRHWEKSKKAAYQTKLPVSIENHWPEIYSHQSSYFDVDKAAKNLHTYMQTILKPREWKVYDCLYIQGMTEEQTAQKIGYKVEIKNGCKQIKNLKKIIIAKVKQALKDNKIDIE